MPALRYYGADAYVICILAARQTQLLQINAHTAAGGYSIRPRRGLDMRSSKNHSDAEIAAKLAQANDWQRKENCRARSRKRLG